MIIDIKEILSNPQNLKAINSAFRSLKSQGLYAKAQLDGYIKAGEIPDSVLIELKKVLGVTLEPGKVVKPKKVFTDEDVISLSAALYKQNVKDAAKKDSSLVRAIDGDTWKVVMTTFKGINFYLDELKSRKSRIETAITSLKTAGISTTEQAAAMEDLKAELKMITKSMQLAIKTKATLKTMTEIGGDAMAKVVEFVNSDEMDALNELLGRINPATKSATSQIDGQTTYNLIEEKLKKFNRAASVPVASAEVPVKKPSEPGDGGDDGRRIVDDPKKPPAKKPIDGSDDPVIIDPVIVDDDDDDGGDDGRIIVDDPKKPPVKKPGDDTVVEDPIVVDDGDDDVDDIIPPRKKPGEDSDDIVPPAKKPGDGGDDIVPPAKKPGDGDVVDPSAKKPGVDSTMPPSDDTELVPGSVNVAKTKKIGLGRRFINWIGRHWMLASIVAGAGALAIGALIGPWAPAALSVARFALYNIGTFATIFAGTLAVKYFAFKRKRQANSAQAHFLRRERHVQAQIRKSEKYLSISKNYQSQIDNLEASLSKYAVDSKDYKRIKKEIRKIQDKMLKIDKKNTKLLKKINQEFVPVTLPGAFNIPAKIKHRAQSLFWGTSTLARQHAEVSRYVDGKIDRKPSKAEKLAPMKLDGNFTDEDMNFQIQRRNTYESLKERAEIMKRTYGETDSKYLEIKKYLDALHDLPYAKNAGTRSDERRLLGQVAKSVVLAKKADPTATDVVAPTMQGVEEKEIRFLYDEATRDGAVVVTLPDGTTRRYGADAVADQAQKATTVVPMHKR